MRTPIIILLIFLTPLIAFAHKERWDDNKDGWSKLMLAIYNGETQKYNNLIDKKVDVNFISSGKKTNWRLTAIEVAIRKENGEAVKSLLATNKIDSPQEYLMMASDYSNVLTVELLIKYGANVNDTLKNGYSVVMGASSFGSYEVLQCLLKHGSNVKQIRKVDGMTALMLAALNGDPRKVKLLLDYGADKNVKNTNGNTALYYAEYDNPNVSEKSKIEMRELLK